MPAISPNAFAPPAANDLLAPVPVALREKVRRLERAHSARRSGRAASVPTGLPAVDALLPEGGLLTGALHEIEAGPGPSGRVAPHDGAALGFTAHLLGRFGPGTILWCRRPTGPFDAPPYAPALAAWFDPARLLTVTARRDEDLFWAMEEGLRCPGIAAVVGETRAADPTAGRRLSLAAEKNGVPALLLRVQPAPPQSVCATRWRVASAPSLSTPGLADVGAVRWRLELRRNRFGTPSAAETPSWLLEWNDETHCLAVVPQALHGSPGARFEERLVGPRLAG
jgi:protein ImuA